MKRLHIIHAKNLDDIKPAAKSTILPVLEKETLEWAKQRNPKAYESTLPIKAEAEKDAYTRPKYFKYLRRLLELKLQEIEEELFKLGQKDRPVVLDKELAELLLVETLRLPNALSCTSVAMYLTCKRKWYLRYAMGIKTSKTSALHFGTSVDDALNFYFEEKLKSGKAPPLAAVYSAFTEKFENQNEPVIWGKDKPELLLAAGPPILEAYIKEFGESTKPTGVQTEVTIQLDNGGVLTGFIDILEKDAIVDTKTAKDLWKTDGPYAKHKGELQPKAYSLWFLEEYEKMPQEFRYQIVTKDMDEKGRAKPRTQLISFQLKKFELDGFRREIQKIWDEIMENIKYGKQAFQAQAELEKPSVLCCHEWCDYAKICESDGLKVPLKWDKQKKRHIYAEK